MWTARGRPGRRHRLKNKFQAVVQGLWRETPAVIRNFVQSGLRPTRLEVGNPDLGVSLDPVEKQRQQTGAQMTGRQRKVVQSVREGRFDKQIAQIRIRVSEYAVSPEKTRLPPAPDT